MARVCSLDHHRLVVYRSESENNNDMGITCIKVVVEITSGTVLIYALQISIFKNYIYIDRSP